jgi:monoamine oxidase
MADQERDRPGGERTPEEDHALEHELMESGEPVILHDVPESAELLATPEEGLDRREQPPKRVVIIGAGLAGLVAGFELKRQGHEPIILEAQNRVGGRIYTLRSFAPGLYAEAGGMRIPRAHDLTLAYCELFDLELRPFVMGNPKGIVHIGGVRMTAEEAARDPDRLPFELAEHEKGRSPQELWDEAIADLRAMVESDGDAAWEQIVRDYDRYSLYDFLRLRGFSEGAIEYYAVMNFL